ncbi:MFS transporter [Dactylosporangium sp. NPDC051541]|uniref:MFS transporter n=1 Tax=Dactylosporangium sp. NPDC051541 TaxID=3363977 RepID=UPI0037880F7A
MRPYGVFLLVSGVGAFGSSCAYTLNVLFQIQVVGLGPLGLVLVGTVLEGVYLLAQVPMGLLADARGRRLPVLLGVFLTGAGTVLQGAVPTLAATLAGTALWGAGAACFDGAFEAWAADELGEDRIGAALTRGAQLGQAATVAGMLTAAALATVRPALPMLVGGAAWLLLGLVLLPALRSGFVPAPRSGSRGGGPRWAPGVRTLALATLFVALGREGFDRLGPDHVLTTVPSTAPAPWFSTLAIVTIVAAIPLTRLLRSLPGGGRALAAVLAVQVAAMAVFALSTSFFVAAFSLVLAGALRAAADPLWTTWLVAQTTAAERATVLSAVGTVGALGEIAGGPPAGWLGRRFSVARSLLACAAVTAPAVLVLGLDGGFRTGGRRSTGGPRRPRRPRPGSRRRG